jgi:hypothetical protein
VSSSGRDYAVFGWFLGRTDKGNCKGKCNCKDNRNDNGGKVGVKKVRALAVRGILRDPSPSTSLRVRMTAAAASVRGGKKARAAANQPQGKGRDNRNDGGKVWVEKVRAVVVSGILRDPSPSTSLRVRMTAKPADVSIRV